MIQIKSQKCKINSKTCCYIWIDFGWHSTADPVSLPCSPATHWRKQPRHQTSTRTPQYRDSSTELRLGIETARWVTAVRREWDGTEWHCEQLSLKFIWYKGIKVVKLLSISSSTCIAGLILGLRPANERHYYKVMHSLIGWVQTWNQPCIVCLVKGFNSIYEVRLIWFQNDYIIIVHPSHVDHVFYVNTMAADALTIVFEMDNIARLSANMI